ncbi:RidA family protein [Burkholderia sp. JKS000303]|uniref:RidA family protein n=1 Tax=Burkholderia sp. JKS000303 TaxID=1938747 RepID=UPI000BF4A56B|nr:RidA family protein [Burkholderia sp. JKS000303]PFH20281.1 enamine deaminase RidA (YjgF/YER057c/UK114 family) [Burkholderia sp. JKS000303]
MSIYDRVREAGITLPALAIPAAAFRPYVLHGNQLIVSGQLPVRDGKAAFVGSVPDSVSVSDAQDAARLCVINILAWAHHATGGDLNRIRKVLRLGGFVSTSSGFADAPAVINAASELVTQIFGERGSHARIAIGVASLPLNAPVEVEAAFALEE